MSTLSTLFRHLKKIQYGTQKDNSYPKNKGRVVGTRLRRKPSFPFLQIFGQNRTGDPQEPACTTTFLVIPNVHYGNKVLYTRLHVFYIP